jgi:hypothetical protein
MELRAQRLRAEGLRGLRLRAAASGQLDKVLGRPTISTG